MKRVLLGVVLVLGCHKKDARTGAGSVGSAEVVGSAATSATTDTAGSAAVGSATVVDATQGSATAGSATDGSASAGPQAAAVDTLDRWIAPIYKLAVPDRYRAICRAAVTIRRKADELRVMPPPPGVDAQVWTQANETFADDVGGVGMCCNDLADYEKASASEKEVADGQNEACMKPLPASFAALAKLVPGAPAPGTHANDPVMKPAK